jgi:predicted nucleic acid-binding protein
LRLHDGERQAIALARELKLPLSLRILREAKRLGVITEIKPLVHELTRAGMYMSDVIGFTVCDGVRLQSSGA